MDLCLLKAECACRDFRHLELTTLTPLATPPPPVFPGFTPYRNEQYEAEVVGRCKSFWSRRLRYLKVGHVHFVARRFQRIHKLTDCPALC
jgi:hypothetical protein